MMNVLEKRTRESLRYDFGCWDLLVDGETIVGTPTMAASEPAGLTFGTPVVNTGPITYPSGFVAQPGQVVQVQISGGVIAVGQVSQRYVVRCVFNTSISPNQAEATAYLLVKDQP